MKIGIFTDIHNNITALNSMLKLLEEKKCDELLCCGDIIGFGPFPEETVQRIKSLKNIKCVLGNHEQYITDDIKYSKDKDKCLYNKCPYHKWEYNSLSDDSKNYIRQLPYILHLNREGIKIAIVHYSINKDNEYRDFIFNPTLTDCEKFFSNIDADIILYGHDHNGSIVCGNNKLYINCGSLGCSRTHEGIAEAGILTIHDKKPTFEKVFAKYDLQKFLREFDSIQYPAYQKFKKFFCGVK